MDDKRRSQKRQSRKKLLEKRKDAAFIAEYVRVKAPDIYAEAENFATKLKDKYPNMRDHTKTVEFRAHCLTGTSTAATSTPATSATSTPATSATSTPATSATSTPATPATATATTDNMRLSIPLLTETVVAENIVPLEPFSVETYQGLMEEMSLDPQLEAIFEDTINDISPLEMELMTT